MLTADSKRGCGSGSPGGGPGAPDPFPSSSLLPRWPGLTSPRGGWQLVAHSPGPYMGTRVRPGEAQPEAHGALWGSPRELYAFRLFNVEDTQPAPPDAQQHGCGSYSGLRARKVTWAPTSPRNGRSPQQWTAPAAASETPQSSPPHLTGGETEAQRGKDWAETLQQPDGVLRGLGWRQARHPHRPPLEQGLREPQEGAGGGQVTSRELGVGTGHWTLLRLQGSSPAPALRPRLSFSFPICKVG